MSLQGWVPVQIKDAFCVDLLEQTIRARSSALARWSSDLDIQGHYLRGCREFYSLACAVTRCKFPDSVPGREVLRRPEVLAAFGRQPTRRDPQRAGLAPSRPW
jgi:hypothetical protein